MSLYPPSLQLNRLALQNYWGIKDAIIDFHPDLTVLIGRNGSGKTSILDALAKAFRMVEVSLLSGDTKVDPANFFLDRDIHNESSGAEVRLKATLDFQAELGSDSVQGTFASSQSQRARGKVRSRSREEFDSSRGGELDWRYTLTRSGHQVTEGGQLEDLYRFVEYINFVIRHEDPAVKGQAALPIAAFYDCGRAADLSLEIQTMQGRSSQASIFDAWEEALSEGSFAYEAFFKWFRRAFNRFQQAQDSSQEKRIFQAVCQAIYQMFDEGDYFESLGFSWETVEGEITVKKKQGPDLRLSQLSSGERVLLLMAADLSRRLVIANPQSENPLQTGSGVVMIDEVGLHLHPSWQGQVIGKLRKTFPKIQFIVTTHSPHVLQNVERESIRLLEAGVVQDHQPYVEGRDVNSILEEAFGIKERLEKFDRQVKKIYDLLDEEKFPEAEAEINQLKQKWGEEDREIN
ncbi:MAG: AAA family ATPase, partial [Bacteroidota bacterium]